MRITIKAALISGLISGLITLIGIYVNSKDTKQANEIARAALNESKKTADLYSDIYKQKDIPRLEVYPISVKFYIPDKPEVPGQIKISIGTIIKNLSEANAKDISLNLETKDWYDHYTNWFNIYKDAKLPIPHIASLAKNTEIIYPSYAPDTPSAGEDGYVNQDKPFLLKITLSWKDNNNKEYVYVAFYRLEHSRLVNDIFLYFSKIEAYDSVIDGRKAWEESEISLKEYQYKNKS